MTYFHENVSSFAVLLSTSSFTLAYANYLYTFEYNYKRNCNGHVFSLNYIMACCSRNVIFSSIITVNICFACLFYVVLYDLH